MPDPTQPDLAEVLLDALAKRVAAQAQPPREAPRRTKDHPERPRYVDEHEAARQLMRSVQTLRGARSGRGPLAKALVWHKVAGRIMYAQKEIDRLIEGGRREPSAA